MNSFLSQVEHSCEGRSGNSWLLRPWLKWRCLSGSWVWLFVTPQTTACQAPLSTEFSRQEYWSGEPSPSPGDLSDPGIKPRTFECFCKSSCGRNIVSFGVSIRLEKYSSARGSNFQAPSWTLEFRKIEIHWSSIGFMRNLGSIFILFFMHWHGIKMICFLLVICEALKRSTIKE